MSKQRDKQMAAIKKAITEARRKFAKEGLLPTRWPDVRCFIPGGMAPRNRREWESRKRRMAERYKTDHAKVRSWFDWLGKQMGGNVLPEVCFKHLSAEKDVGTVEEGEYGRLNEGAEPGVAFPIFLAGGRTKPKDWRCGYHWHVARYEGGQFVCDCWGGMIASKSLYHVVLWAWVQTVVCENENYQKTYADAEVIG